MTVQTTYSCPHCNHPVDVDPRQENETLVCPNEACRKPFKVEIPTAQPAPQLLLPESANQEASAPSPPAAPLAHPASEVKEEPVQVVHLSMFRRYPFRCTVYILATIAALAGFLVLLIAGWRILALACLGAAGFVAFRFGSWWLRMKHTTLTITNLRSILESGVFTRQSAVLPLSEVEDVKVNQTFVQRLLHVGDLVLTDRKTAAPRMVVMAVPTPQGVAEVIRQEQLAHHA